MPAGRNGAIDYLRFLGAIGIVWFHMKLPGAWLGYAALPMFIMLLVHFGHGRSLKERANRLLVPWLMWCGVFALMKLGDVVLTSSTFAQEFQPWMLLAGPSLHLWFLPFSFLFLLVISLMRAQLLLLALPVSCAAVWICNSTELPWPFAQWIYVLPAAFFGVFLKDMKTSPLMVGGVLALCSVAYLSGVTQVVPQLLIAMCLIVLVLNIQLPATSISQEFSDLSLGVYLVHPLMISVILRTPLAEDPWGAFFWVTALSILLVMVLRRVAPAMVGLSGQSSAAVPGRA